MSTVVADFGVPAVLSSGEGVEFLFVDNLEVLPVACPSTEPLAVEFVADDCVVFVHLF